MAQELHRCKITVLKAMINQDLVDAYLNAGPNYGPCSTFRVGQEFVVEQPWDIPKGFCAWAWADIKHDILALMTGSDKPWLKQPGVEIVGCTDWYRPVYFKLERLVQA